MYSFIKEKKDELLDGRIITYVANKIGITREYLSMILLNKRTCSKMTAYCIVKACNSEAEITNYFKKIK